MTHFINKQITKTSIFSIINGIVWIFFASILFYGFTFWFDPSGKDWIGVVIFDIAFLALFFTYAEKIYSGIKCLLNVKNHKVYKKFEKYGDIILIKNQVENEIMEGISVFSKMIYTQNWIIKNSNLDFDCVNIFDISWAYEKTTTILLNYVLPIGNDYSIVLHANQNEIIEIQVKKANIIPFLSLIASKNPSCKIGYSKEHERFFLK